MRAGSMTSLSKQPNSGNSRKSDDSCSAKGYSFDSYFV